LTAARAIEVEVALDAAMTDGTTNLCHAALSRRACASNRPFPSGRTNRDRVVWGARRCRRAPVPAIVSLCNRHRAVTRECPAAATV